MNILMLGRWVPPARSPLKGTREYEFARALAHTHRLTLAFATDNPRATGPISALRDEFGDLEFAAVPRGWKSVASAVRLATGASCTLSYFRSEALTRRLSDRARTGQYALAYVSSSSMIGYALHLDPKIPILVDFGFVDSQWWFRQARHRSFARFFQTEATRLRMAETAITGRASRCVTATVEAAEIVRSFAPTLPIIVIPDGVTIDAYRRSGPRADASTVVFATPLKGSEHVEDIRRFCREVIPEVSAQVPAARFLITSRDERPSLAELRLPSGVQIATGLVDTRPLLLQRAAVAVAPVWNGSAARESILDAMAGALPVVATPRGCQQLDVEPGRDLLVAEEPTGFAKAISDLLRSQRLRDEVGAAGRRVVERSYSWIVMGERLRALVESVVTSPGVAIQPAVLPTTATALEA